MPGEHARLSPSSSERWISCPASVRVADQLPRELQESESIYALEGTAAHALAEIEGRRAFGLLDDNGYRHALAGWRRVYAQFKDSYPEMREHVLAYVALLKERQQLYPNTQVLFEQRVDSGVPSCWGTSDAVLVSPQHVEIVDFKYGQGVPVNAIGNSQLRLYGLGALDGYGDLLGETEIVRMTVFQPRLESTSTEEMTAIELREWRADIIPIAESALGPDAPFGPSEEACRWCPASGRCPAQFEQVTKADFGTPPDTLTPNEMAAILQQIPAIRDWLNAFEETALNLVYSEGKEIPGYKVVLSGGRRSIPDENFADVCVVLTEHGYDLSQFTKLGLVGIGDLTKMLGRGKAGEKQFELLLGDFVKKSAGKPSLVPEDDARPAANPEIEAAKDFT